MKKMRKGFTLIELLVVVSVLGSLAAMMSIASGEAMTSAKAAKIINNLRNFAAAANEYYADNMNRFYGVATTNAPEIAKIRLYMNEGSKNSTEPEAKLTNYCVATATVANKSYAEVDWYVGYAFPAANAIGAAESEAIKIKLEGRAKEIGLYGSAALDTDADTLQVIQTEANFVASTHNVIWFKAREKSRR